MKTQQIGTADPKTVEELREFTAKHSEAYTKHDATAYAAFFTEDAVLVTPEGMIYGRQAIEKKYAELFDQWHPTDYVVKVEQVNTIGNEAWKIGEWSCTLQTEGGPYPISGYFASIHVRVDGVWKERMMCYNMATRSETK
jgi:uncharacterized protein (TIGR02246 family)